MNLMMKNSKVVYVRVSLRLAIRPPAAKLPRLVPPSAHPTFHALRPRKLDTTPRHHPWYFIHPLPPI